MLPSRYAFPVSLHLPSRDLSFQNSLHHLWELGILLPTEGRIKKWVLSSNYLTKKPLNIPSVTFLPMKGIIP